MISASPVHRGSVSVVGRRPFNPLHPYHFAHPILPTFYTIISCGDNLFFILNSPFIMAFMFIMLGYCEEKLDVGHVRSQKRLQQLLKVLAGATLNCVRSFGSCCCCFLCSVIVRRNWMFVTSGYERSAAAAQG